MWVFATLQLFIIFIYTMRLLAASWHERHYNAALTWFARRKRIINMDRVRPVRARPSTGRTHVCECCSSLCMQFNSTRKRWSCSWSCLLWYSTFSDSVVIHILISNPKHKLLKRINTKQNQHTHNQHNESAEKIGRRRMRTKWKLFPA